MLRAQAWIAPTPEELAMKSIPEVPGARAVYLYKEQVTDDARHMFSFYVRLKVLTEGGKELANVELPYVSDEAKTSVDSVAGRTIQPDGTIVPFTGKPYQKTIEKAAGFKVKAVVFSLPAVEVGSIIEYRYKIHMDDNYYSAPDWDIQGDLYVRKAHYQWTPTSQLLTSADGKTSSSVAWTTSLPPGAAVKESTPLKGAALTTSSMEGNSLITLDVHDIPPLPHEEYMPPMETLRYRVRFYYTDVRSADEYWKQHGKIWAREQNKFIGPNNVVKDAVAKLVSPTDTEDQKLHKLYTEIMSFDNTDFSRTHEKEEDKAAGLKRVSNAGDVIERRRGNSNELAMTFVAMARAAGMKAYPMAVTDRSRAIFVMSYLSMSQLDDEVAVVMQDGKSGYFDPGERYCAFGHLAWQHTMTGGLRETDGGNTALFQTPAESYNAEHVTRVADLQLDDDHGIASGTVTMTFTGDPALRWRHVALRGDDASIKRDLRTNLEEMLPGGMEITVDKIENLTDSERPLKVSYTIKGAVGSPTGKRLLVPMDVFEANTKARFPEKTRTYLVDMRYASYYQDAVRYKLPPSMVVESAPTATREEMPKTALYTASVAKDAKSITLYRNLTMGAIYIKPEQYADLRTFYSKLEGTDQGPVVLTRAVAEDKAAGTQ
jgi:hypothetical protein